VAIINDLFEEQAEEWLANYRSNYSYKPHSTIQAAAHFSKADTVCMVCGRREGKTRCACGATMMLVEQAARTRFITTSGEDLTHTLHPNVHVAVLGPRNSLIRQVIEEFQAIVPPHMIVRDRSGNAPGELGVPMRAVIGEDRRMTMNLRMYDENMRIARGVVRPEVRVEFFSAESRVVMQSKGLDVLLITEAQDVPEEMYQQALPMLSSPGRMGKLIVEGISPDSSESWFAKLAWTAVKDTTGTYDIVIAETADNPLLTSKELRRIWRQRGTSMTTAEWDRVYRAVLPTAGGGFFPYIADVMVPGLELAGPKPGCRYVAGWDHGRRESASVVTVKDAATAESVTRLMFENQEPYEFQITMVEQLHHIWNLQQINMDATGQGGDILFGMAQARGLPVIPVDFNSEKTGLYNRYAIGCENRTVSFPAEWGDYEEQFAAIRTVKNRSSHSQTVFESVGNIKDDKAESEMLAYDAADDPQVMQRPASPVVRSDREIPDLVPDAVIAASGLANLWLAPILAGLPARVSRRSGTRP